MTSAVESPVAAAATLPGLEHLRGHVQNWEAAVRTLSLTATALAESAGAAAPAKRAWPDPEQGEAVPRGAARLAPPAPAPPAPAPPTLLLPRLPAPSLVVPAGSQLKPGRVFVVANLQGAYYTLLELLARHKFDFRTDNLMHLGNLVAPPAAAPAPAPAAGDDYGQEPLPQQQQQQQQPRRFRHSASVLKMVGRHGGLGPMGANECLALLAAARSNRQREKQRAAAAEEEGRRLEGALKAGALEASRGGRCSALTLSLHLAAAATAAAPAPAAAPAVPFRRCSGRPASALASTPASRLGSSDGFSDSSSDDSDSDGEVGVLEEADVEMVTAPMTPHPDDEGASPSQFAAAITSTPAAAGGGGGAGGGAALGSKPSLDDANLAQLLSMPACVVLEAYGIKLLHAGPLAGREEEPNGAASSGRYHVLFSHRRPGGGGSTGGGGGAGATATGLASCRGDVVRFAVLPPLRTLQCRSPGFGARLAAAAAPSREDLLLEMWEEPLSALDA